MKIKSVVISNYKSLGDERNTLLLEDNITALIGKNDSGKSNILEALGNMSFTHYINTEFFSKKNRYTKKSIVITLELKFTESECKKFSIENKKSKTIFKFYSSDDIEFEGGFSLLFDQDNELKNAIYYLEDNLLSYFKIYSQYTTKEFIESIDDKLDKLIEIDSRIWTKYKKSLNEILEVLILQQKDMAYEGYNEECYTLIRHIETIKSKIKKKYKVLPVFYYRTNEEELQSIYNVEEIKSAIKSKKGLLYKFMVITKAPLDEFINSIDSKDENERNKCRSSIKEKVKYNIQKQFNYFFENNIDTKIKVNFDNECLKIYLKTNDNQINLEEESNGLKWLFNLFIELLYEDLENKTIIYLLDEPGVYLHVNAQRELLTLLKSLCNNGSQVVYTTHSPYMIDTEDIINVRAIEKDENGISHIFNNAYDNKFNSSSKRETLTPLLKAIGADIKYNLGPRLDKLNIVTEGITDYMYFTAMLDYLEVQEEKRPYILPSVGAGNVNALVSILIGWGCNYKVVLDYDKAGVIECNKLIENLNLRLNKEVFFINCKKTMAEKEFIRNPEFVETLISQEDKNQLSVRYEENKTMAAKEFYDKVIAKDIVLSEKTVNNFRKLFMNLKIIE
ncbi:MULTISPECIES: ATP-dependent endonuclease [Clostridia]|uniref:ATP-dependent nuclease n=1 Tax=Clostridia TaxID=186801 RepID=UPI0018A8C1B0|nr:ATP-binding protein [Clostridium sp. 1001270J_160509_D11]